MCSVFLLKNNVPYHHNIINTLCSVFQVIKEAGKNTFYSSNTCDFSTDPINLGTNSKIF